MLAKIRNTFLAFTIAATSAVPAGANLNGDDGTFYFRYKQNDLAYVPPVMEEKDVVAYFVGGIGHPMSETLPLKPEWQDDTWRLDVGSRLPDGITFNTATRTFEGTPTVITRDHGVFLSGVDSNGNFVASAQVKFNVYAIDGIGTKLDLYAHTGRFHTDELPIPPGLAIDRWETPIKLPDGISVAARYFEGTPTKARQWPIMLVGMSNDKPVATFFGTYTVEDAPTFPLIRDDVRNIPIPGKSTPPQFPYTVPGTFAVNRAIDPSKPVRYAMEIKQGDTLPEGVTIRSAQPTSYRLDGYVTIPYETATIRWKAVDSDGTVGYSNWFRFGSGDPELECGGGAISVYTGIASKLQVPPPSGSQGLLEFSLKSGKIPIGLSMNTDGLMTGTATTAGEQTSAVIEIGMTVNGVKSSSTCDLRFAVSPGGVYVADVTPQQSRHLRVGKTYTGEAAIGGGINPYSVSFADAAAANGFTFLGPISNVQNVTVTGTVTKTGPQNIGLKLSNGDASEKTGNLGIHGYGDLSVGNIPTVRVKRLAASDAWATVPYDAATVIPDVSAETKQPAFTLSGPALPRDVQLTSDGQFSGTTSVPAGTYGPYTVTLSDFSGDTDVSNTFNVEVEPRDEIAVELVVEPAFRVEWDQTQSFTPASVEQPVGARDFAVTWSINGTLPSWLSLDASTGKLTAAPGIPQAEKGVIGPFTMTATDQEGSTATTEAFNITIVDWPTPSAAVTRAFKGTVSGNTSAGEAATWINIPGLYGTSLRDFVDPSTVIGGRQAVTFGVTSPTLPAGLAYDPTTGTFSGRPTSEFNGKIEIEFFDGKNRRGVMEVPLEVRAYPAAAMTQAEYELPRLSLAQDIGTKIAPTITASWNAASWVLDTTKGPALPAGLTVDPSSGQIEGKTTVAVGTRVNGLYLRAASNGANGERLESWAGPFSITVTAPEPIALSYSSPKATFYLKRDGGIYDLVRSETPVPSVTGSHVSPLTYSMDKTQAVADGLVGDLDVNTSNGNIVGSPSRLGSWPIYLSVKDAEGRTVPGPVALTAKATLDGMVKHDGPKELVRKVLRVNEPFYAPAIAVSNEVGDVAFTLQGANIPATVDFSPVTGEISDESYFAQDTGLDAIYISIEGVDADSRHLEQPIPSYEFSVRPPLTASIPVEASRAEALSYGNGKFETFRADFRPEVKEQIGNVSYSLSGDLPGTLVNRLYDASGAPTVYEWKENGTTRTSASASALPADALVFDTANAVLEGVPSRAGTFTATLTARDDHMDAYIRDVGSRVSNNTAVAGIVTIEVKAAPALEAKNSIGGTVTSTDNVALYTKQASLVSTVSNAARGEPVTWTQLSGTLPDGVTPTTLDHSIVYSGYPTVQGTFPNIVWRATDAVGRQVQTDPVTIVVSPRLQITLAATENPAYLIVDTTDTDVVVTASNTAFNDGIKAADWSILNPASLPPGVTFSAHDDELKFAGLASVVGSFTATVEAKDAVGSTGRLDMHFNVIEPIGEIGLTVADIRTKVGYPVSMQPSTTNTYGPLRFYSLEIDGDPQTHVPGELSSDLNIALSNGSVTGSFSAVGEHTADIYVTDGTKRLVSKPVAISVLRDIRVTVPAEFTAPQGDTLARTTTTDYVLGTVTYEKANAQAWPDGVTVNPTTGTIEGVATAAVGRYEKLAIRATDTFTVAGQTYTDSELSNEFTIVVAPINASPVISDIPSNKLPSGSLGVAFAFTPTVKDSRFGNPWNYAGTVYSLNKPISQLGLSFNTATGVISGTPTASGTVPDLVITVTSANGDADSTAPFWIGVAPESAITAPANQVAYARKNTTGFRSTAVVFNNAVGKLRYDRLSGNGTIGFDSDTGQFYYNADFTWWSATDYPATIKVTDEFGRTATTQFTLIVREAMTVTYNEITGYAEQPIGGTIVSINNQLATPVISVAGLPAYLSVNPSTGALSGTVPASEIGKVYNLDVSVLDPSENLTFTGTSKLTISATMIDKACIVAKEDNRYAALGGSTTWFMSFHGNVAGSRGYNGQPNAEIADVRFYDANGDCYIADTTKTYAYQDGKTAEVLADGNPQTTLTDYIGSGIYFYFGVKNVVFTKVVVTMKGNTSKDLNVVWVCRGTSNYWSTSLMNYCAPNIAKFNPNGQMYAPGEKRTFEFGTPSNWVYYSSINYTE